MGRLFRIYRNLVYLLALLNRLGEEGSGGRANEEKLGREQNEDVLQ